MSLNKVILIGRLTNDVEVQEINEKTSKAKFTLAVDRNYKTKNSDKPETDFINIVAWNGSAKFASQYFHKGKQVYVVGSLETYKYESDGTTKYGFNIKADEVGFADSKSGGDNNNQVQNTAQQNVGGNSIPQDDFGSFPNDFEPIPGDFDDDLPFGR